MTLLSLAFVSAFATLVGCSETYPEVVVVNKIDEKILIKDISFNGCLWEGVLRFEETTNPARCLPGKDRIHFKTFDPSDYCKGQLDKGHELDGLCLCDDTAAEEANAIDYDIGGYKPVWYNYQSITVKKVGYGGFHLWEITADDIEQDFSAPSPFGH